MERGRRSLKERFPLSVIKSTRRLTRNVKTPAISKIVIDSSRIDALALKHAQFGLPDKGCIIKGLVVSWMLFNLIPRDFR